MNEYSQNKIYVRIAIGVFLVCVFFWAMPSCGHHAQDKANVNTYTVKEEALHKTLHFTGTIQPLQENTLTSPLEAVVESMNFHYGQLVKKGDIVLTLNSTELQRQFNDTLTDYLKAKDSYRVSKARFVGTEELWGSGLISKNNYLSEKSGLDTTRVALMQASQKLTEMITKMDASKTKDVSTLSLGDFDKIKKILMDNHNVISLRAPSDGVLLYPPKSGEDKATRVSVGSSVKAGQVIGLIGDLTGISVEIDIPEIDIDKVYTGMNARITGVAFGRLPLSGKVVAVNAQASSNTSGSLPSFTALVEVHSLSPEQQKTIKVGMSASIELSAESSNQLIIPIAAVKREKGASIVQIQLAQGGTEKRVITTGAAQADTVVVETGLKAGDIVLYD